MKKFIFAIILFLAIAVMPTEAQEKKEDLIKSIAVLRDSLTKEQIRLNHFVYEKYIEVSEAENMTLPTAAITLALAKKDPRIDSLRKAFEKIDEDMEVMYRQDTAYLAAITMFNARTPGSSDKFYEVRSRLLAKLTYNEEYKELRKKHSETLFRSNLEAFKLYVKTNKEQNKYMDFKLDEYTTRRILENPEAKRISASIELIEKMIKIKEAELLYQN